MPFDHGLTRRQIYDKAKSANKDAREKVRPGELHSGDIVKLLDMCDGNCALCDKPMEDGDIRLNHIVPFFSNGENTRENIQLTHTRCAAIKARRPNDIGRFLCHHIGVLKYCFRCKRALPVALFYSSQIKWDKRDNVCKGCYRTNKPVKEVEHPIACPQCGKTSGQRKLNVLPSGSQRYICKDCEYSYTPKPVPGRSKQVKQEALRLYIQEGISAYDISKLLGVSASTVGKWVREP